MLPVFKFVDHQSTLSVDTWSVDQLTVEADTLTFTLQSTISHALDSCQSVVLLKCQLYPSPFPLPTGRVSIPMLVCGLSEEAAQIAVILNTFLMKLLECTSTE